MEFKELLDGLWGQKQTGKLCGITAFEKAVKKGFVFVCIKGQNADGHEYAKGALKRGATFVVVQKDLKLGPAQILVKDTREAYARLCAAWFKNPAESLTCFAVTGTNGKTTTTSLIWQLLKNLVGEQVGLIGTVQNEIGGVRVPAKYTTPEPFELHTILAQMRGFGCEYAVLEASSHALEQKRLFGLQFKVAAFTNLTQDHLDFHGTMENYFEAKKRLFDAAEKFVINIDAPFGKRLEKELKQKGWSGLAVSAQDKTAEIFVKNINLFATKSEFELAFNGGCYRCCFKMPGRFSVYNAAVAFGVLVAAGFAPAKVAAALAECEGAVGRAEVIYQAPGLTVMRDYAHGPDGLKNILETVKPFVKGRLLLLFGCAGERDRTKREEMGAVAAEFADFVVLTSDNPRGEPEEQIMQDAEAGLKNKNTPYLLEKDRLKAIKLVLKNRQEDDFILLAGKGHEDYQVLRDCTVFFDEKQIVADLLIKAKERC